MTQTIKDMMAHENKVREIFFCWADRHHPAGMRENPRELFKLFQEFGDLPSIVEEQWSSMSADQKRWAFYDL